ncbi:MAG TPA: cytochrome P450 [Amycolatopsis sp.]|nr:cytochrome P450 [Amycolatopsis sp.]
MSREDEEFGSASFLADPYPSYHRWQAEAPVWWSAKMKGWMVSRYDDVRTVLTRHHSWHQSLYFEGALVDAFEAMTMIATNPPDHTELRRRAAPFFRPSSLEARMKEVVEGIVDDLASGPRHGESFELGDLTGPLVLRVMAALMGTDDSAHLAELYRRVLEHQRRIRSHVPEAAARESGMNAGRELIGYLGEQAAVRGRSPLYDALTDAGIERKLALSACALTLAGGVETTMRGLASTMYALVNHQDQLDRVRQDPDLALAAFEEGLRWVSPVQLKARQATEDVTLAGQVIRAGQTVFPLLGAANRDERHYPEPDRFDLDRRAADHVAFGSGIHYCLGAPLAKLEARLFIQKLVARFGSLRFAPGYAADWEGPIHRSPSKVMLVGKSTMDES